MTAIKRIATDEAITKEIKTIKANGKKLQEAIHRVAVSIMARWLETGDRRPMLTNINALVEAIPEMGRKGALLAWAQLYLKLDYQDKQLTWPEALRYTPDEAAIAVAEAEPFWALKPEPEYKPVDFNGLIARLVKAAEKDLEKSGEASTVDLAKLDALKAMLA